jgi:hypothetical protein
MIIVVAVGSGRRDGGRLPPRKGQASQANRHRSFVTVSDGPTGREVCPRSDPAADKPTRHILSSKAYRRIQPISRPVRNATSRRATQRKCFVEPTGACQHQQHWMGASQGAGPGCLERRSTGASMAGSDEGMAVILEPTLQASVDAGTSGTCPRRGGSPSRLPPQRAHSRRYDAVLPEW